MSKFYEQSYKDLIKESVAWETKAMVCLPKYIEAKHKMLDELEAEFPKRKFSDHRWPTSLGNYSFGGFDETDICFEFWASGWTHGDSYFMPASFIWAPLVTIDAEKQKIRNEHLAAEAERQRKQQEAIAQGEESEKERLRALIERYPEEASQFMGAMK